MVDFQERRGDPVAGSGGRSVRGGVLVEGLACRAGAGTTPWGDYECVFRTHLEKSGVRAGESPKVQIHLGGLSQNIGTRLENLRHPKMHLQSQRNS